MVETCWKVKDEAWDSWPQNGSINLQLMLVNVGDNWHSGRYSTFRDILSVCVVFRMWVCSSKLLKVLEIARKSILKIQRSFSVRTKDFQSVVNDAGLYH